MFCPSIVTKCIRYPPCDLSVSLLETTKMLADCERCKEVSFRELHSWCNLKVEIKDQRVYEDAPTVGHQSLRREEARTETRKLDAT